MIQLLALLPMILASLLPNYGVCKVYTWTPEKVWFVWESAPSNDIMRYEMTFYVHDLRSGADYLTGAADYLVIDRNAYTYLDLDAGDYRISGLTCIARHPDMSYESTQNAGEWIRRIIRLPFAERR